MGWSLSGRKGTGISFGPKWAEKLASPRPVNSTFAIFVLVGGCEILAIWARADFLNALENAVPCKKSWAVCEASGKCVVFNRGKMAKVEVNNS